jgi:hypothetical protein
MGRANGRDRSGLRGGVESPKAGMVAAEDRRVTRVAKLSLALGVCAALAMASPALASQIPEGQIRVGYSHSEFGPYQSGQGGEFTLTVVGDWLDLAAYDSRTSGIGPAGITSFQSFCIEKSEVIDGGATYNAAVTGNAMNGGVGPGGDPVSAGTGWLYSQFAQGTLDDYAYLGSSWARRASAAEFQEAIWWLEGDGSYDRHNVFIVAVMDEFHSKSAAKADGGAQYGVYALNLWSGNDSTRHRAQDQLYFRGLPIASQEPVPDGGQTGVMLGGALVAIAALACRDSLRSRSSARARHRQKSLAINLLR